MDYRAGAKVLEEQIYVQSCTGENQLQGGNPLDNVPHFSEEEVSQAIALVNLILFGPDKPE